MAGRLWLCLGSAGRRVACSQLADLKARKHFKDANGLYQQQDYRQAAAEYEEAIKADPGFTEAYFYPGQQLRQLYKPARKGEADNDGLPPGAL